MDTFAKKVRLCARLSDIAIIQKISNILIIRKPVGLIDISIFAHSSEHNKSYKLIGEYN